MARLRLSAPARADIAAILALSRERFGGAASDRYRTLLTAAIRRIASNPEGRSTVSRPEIGDGLRSFHLRHSRNETGTTAVARPVHVIFFRLTGFGVVEIVRILHERMEPEGHLGGAPDR
ncbi:MAG TPA: type II toxin-antitoxin system RelE/ParE family toxin [Bauldia sp.]|nr:type II toxin-antitoxin system RelE/ParE family toxin [Bauldia sp.]